MFPTLIELCDLPPIENLDGISLVPWMRDPGKRREQPAIIVEESGHIAVRTDRHRYIRAPWYQLRESLALVRAWFDVTLLRPLPVLGDPILVDWTQRAGDAPSRRHPGG